jgi:hypothetical protein
MYSDEFCYLVIIHGINVIYFIKFVVVEPYDSDVVLCLIWPSYHITQRPRVLPLDPNFQAGRPPGPPNVQVTFIIRAILVRVLHDITCCLRVTPTGPVLALAARRYDRRPESPVPPLSDTNSLASNMLTTRDPQSDAFGRYECSFVLAQTRVTDIRESTGLKLLENGQ